MKKILRWYEKNEYLKAFMKLYEELSLEKQCEIAIDILIKSSDMSDRDYSKIIKEVGTYNPKNYKRWYDINPNIHIAIESLRDLTETQKEEIIHEFSEKIINLYYAANNKVEQI